VVMGDVSSSIVVQGDEDYVEDAPFGIVGALVIWGIMLGIVAVCCVLLGIGLGIGLALILAILSAFGMGAALTSALAALLTQRPRTGWRMFSVLMHSGLMLLAAGAGAWLLAPVLMPDRDRLLCGILVAVAGAIAGGVFGLCLALLVERCIAQLPWMQPKTGLKQSDSEIELPSTGG